MSDDGRTGGAAVAPVTLVTDDGFPIAGTRFRSRGATRGVALVAPATGAPQRYYGAFARHLAGAGWDVLTWDWRGVADSRHGVSTRDPRLTMTAWARQDLAAAIDWAARRACGAPVVLVGHSFGGQAPGLAPNGSRLDGLVLVAAQDGWCGHWRASSRLGLELLWRVAVPSLATLLGRFPSSRLGLGEDLPAEVAHEWARWCRSPGYHGDWSGHGQLMLPILAWSFEDDRIAPRTAVEALLARYASAPAITHHHLDPGRDGGASIGHFGFFRAAVGIEFWDRTLTYMESLGTNREPDRAASRDTRRG
jgi:predicted alpha/beta hydrolase